MKKKLTAKEKTYLTLVGVFLLGMLVVGGTYALFLNFSVFVENGTYDYVSTCFNVDYDTGEDITGDLFPSSSYTGGLSGGVSLLLDQSCNVDGYGNLYLNIEKGAEEGSVLTQTVGAHCEDSNTLETLPDYKDESSCTAVDDAIWVTNGTALKYVLYDVDNSNIVSVGYIETGDKQIQLYTGIDVSTLKQFDIYIWLDGNLSDDTYSNLSFSANISAEVIQVATSYANVPVLDEGMIPVTIADDGTVTTISETNKAWYNYENREWANVVLVDSDSRSSYLGTTGKTVSSDDILAYYVWIPRYKYKIWTTGVSSTGSEQTIDIVFETKDTAISNGTTIGGYKTHPAFIWDGSPISGIWVGKFETTGDATTPTVLPNAESLRNQNVSTQFTTSLKFAGGTQSGNTVTFAGNNTYGLASNTDSHMMKNSEWGAVAYLSHSQYGINDEVRINNYYNEGTLTGCGALTEDETASTTCGIVYGSSSDYPQSTTGNINGIFDISGGAWEYVMGVFSDLNGNPRSVGSGFNGLLSDDSEYTSGISFPNSKYYDLYLQAQFTGDYNTNKTLCTLDTCGGHALNETAGWYSDLAYFVSSGSPWFTSGGGWGDKMLAGAFYSDDNSGSASDYRSWRSVLIVNDYVIRYDANGGSGAPSSQEKEYGVSLTLSATKPKRDGYTFLGWGLSADSTTVVYESGDKYTANKGATLYAIWRESILSDLTTTSNSCMVSGEVCDSGTKFTINVNSSTAYDFYVISDTGTEATLIMGQNLVAASAWYSESLSTNGPVTALSALETATSGWTNIPLMTYTLTNDDDGHEDTTKYTYSDILVENVRTRMPTYTELNSVGCTVTTGNECPSWMYKSGEQYWLSTALSIRNYRAWLVGETGVLNHEDVSSSELIGIRPVIVLNK